MEVKETKTQEGIVTRIEFIGGGGEEDFRVEVWRWIQRFYPDMTLQQFFGRLMEFRQNGYCSISMLEGD